MDLKSEKKVISRLAVMKVLPSLIFFLLFLLPIHASTAWPNEPAGSSTLLDWDESAPSGTDAGGHIVNGDCSVVNNPNGLTTPASPPKALQELYPLGFGGGTAACNQYTDPGSRTQLFMGFWWMVSNPWQGHNSNVNKIVFVLDDGSGSVDLQMYGPPTGPFQLCFFQEQGTSSFGRYCGGPDIILGTWHRVEWYMKYSRTSSSNDGIARVWLDGTQIINLMNLNYDVSRQLIEPIISPTWGGVGDTKRETDYYWFDHWYVSDPSTTASSCTQTLSPGANVANAVSSAAAGTIICLNAGNYGSVSFRNIIKSDYVTVQSTSGRTASMNLAIDGTTRFIRLKNLTINGLDFGGGGSSCPTNIQVLNSDLGANQAVFRTDACGANNNLLVDGNTFGAFNAGNTFEGRLEFCCGGVAPSGITVSNNIFGPGGCSDGVQTAAVGIVIGPGNVFKGIVQGNCAAHVDAIQGYGQSHTVITGNYFTDNTIDVGIYDGGASETITNNVFGPPREQLQNLQLGGIQGMTFTHNTFRDTTIAHGTKFANTPNSNWLVRDNVFVNSDLINSGDQGQCNGCTYSFNLFDAASSSRGTNVLTGSPTFVGGANPSTWAGYQLTSTSLGHGAASDGLDMGATIFGSVTPNPDITPPSTPTLNSPTVISSYQINLQWSSSTDAESGISGYNIYRCSGSSTCAPTLLSNVGNTNSYSDNGLAPNTIYRYQISAVNGVSLESIKSSIQTATTPQQSTNTITIGETNILTSGDNANANLLLAQQATLSQTAAIQSLSFYVTTASGKLRLGIYDATGPNGGPGTKKAETNEFTPVVGWNTANVITPVSLPAGTYWLSYLPNDNNLAFVKGDGPTSYFYTYNYGTMPTTFSTAPISTTSHWSLYATLNTGASTFNFSLSNSGSKTITQGQSTSNTITSTLSSGTTQSVSFSATGFPTGATSFFSPISCSPSCTTTLTINTINSTPTGNYTININGNGAGLTRTTNFRLIVNPIITIFCSWDFFPRDIPDGKVTLADILVIVGDFGKTSTSPGFNPKMDYNNNNQIDLFDVLSVVAHFGGCSP